MRSSWSQQQHKDLSVYDFNADEVSVEAASAKFRKTSKTLKKKQQESPVTKYKFLEAFSSGLNIKQIKVKSPQCIDLHENGCPKDSIDVDSPERNLASIVEKSEMDENMTSSICYKEHRKMFIGEFDRGPSMAGVTMSRVPLDGNEQVSKLHSDGTPVDLISDDEENSTQDSISQSISASDHGDDEECLGHHVSKSCYTASAEKEKDDFAVVAYPDYVIYGNTLYVEAQLKLSSDSFQVNCSNTSGNNENIILEWATVDIIDIESHWSERVDAALVKFRLNGKENIHDTRDFVQLIFALNDIRCLEKEVKNSSLAERYRGIWDCLHEDDVALDEYGEKHNMFFPRHYFTEISDSFQDVIYPKGDPDAVSISKRDIELLQPDTFINDTIIDFYIKYLKTKIPLNERDRFHFFNSFFFRKLADLDKDPGSASQGRAAFLRVRKWTRKVNIFEKDYIFIPVNFNLHWSLLVICHPGEVATVKEDGISDSPKVPCILHMDSIKGSHNGLKDLVQSYLLEEWRERHSDSADVFTLKFSKLRFVSLELPQQENLFDCGLFLLHYVELFLEEAPVHFSPFNITMFSSFLNVDWFTPSEASFKRSVIRKLIYDLLSDPSQGVSRTNCSNGQFSSRYHEDAIDQKPNISFPNHHYNPTNTSLENAVWSVTEGVNKINPVTSSAVVASFDKQEESAMDKFLEQGANPFAFPALQVHSIQEDTQKPKCSISPKEEHAARNDELISSSVDKYDVKPASGSPITQPCPTSQHYNNKAGGEYEMPLPSAENKGEIDVDCLLKFQNISDMGKQASPCIEDGGPCIEDSGYVSDSTSSSSGENEGCNEDPPQIDAKEPEEEKKCEYSNEEEEEIRETAEQSGLDIKCYQSKDAEVEDHHNNQTGNGDNMNKDSQEFSTQNLTENGISSNEIVIHVDEPSFTNGCGRAKRGGASMRIELQFQKRRKVLPSEGGRVQT